MPDYTQDETEEFWRQQREILDSRTNPIPAHKEPPPRWLIWRPGPPTEPGDYRTRDLDLKDRVSLRHFDKWEVTCLEVNMERGEKWPAGKEIAGPIPQPVEGK